MADLNELNSLITQTESMYDNSKDLAIVTKVGDYLPYVGLYGSNSKEVKKGEFPMGHFGLKQGKTLVDLGPEVPMLFLAWRAKAMDFKNVLSFFDTSSAEFKDVQERADQKNSGCGFGPEFLVWLWEPEPVFATYFMASKTARNEAPNLLGPLEKQGANCKIQKGELIETKEYSWHGPVTKDYEMAPTILPEVEKMQEIINKFKNPPAAQQEVAEEESSDR